MINKKKLIAYTFVAIMVISAFAGIASIIPASSVNSSTNTPITPDSVPSSVSAVSGGTINAYYGETVNFPSLSHSSSATNTSCNEQTTTAKGSYPAPEYPPYPSYPGYYSPSPASTSWTLDLGSTEIDSGTATCSDVTHSQYHSQSYDDGACTDDDGIKEYSTYAYSCSHSKTSWEYTTPSSSYTFESFGSSSGTSYTWTLSIDGSSESGTIVVYSPGTTLYSSQNPTDVGNSVTFTSNASGNDYYNDWQINGENITSPPSNSGNSIYLSTNDSGVAAPTYAGYTTGEYNISIAHSTYYSNGTALIGFTVAFRKNADNVGPDDQYVGFNVYNSAGDKVLGYSKDISSYSQGDWFTLPVINEYITSIGSYTFEYIGGLSATTDTSIASSSFSIDYSSSYTLTHTFSSSGTYNVTDNIINGTGVISFSPSVSEVVNADPTVSISSSHNPSDIGESVLFSSSISGGTSPYNYAWTIYDGTSTSDSSLTTSSSSSFSYTFSSTGSYLVYLTVTDATGYSVSTSITQTVDSALSISITPSHNPADNSQDITYDTSVSGGSGTYTAYSYVLYDGTSTSDSELTSGTASSFSYTYDSTGSYLLTYSVTDSNGYTASTSLTQTVNPDTTVSISSSQNPTDTGKTIEFISTVQYGTSPYTYEWAIDGTDYSTKDVNVTFSNAGTYTIDLTVIDAADYSVETSMSETVHSDPVISASSNVSSADINYPIEFSSSPSGGTSPYTYSWTIGGTQVSTSQDFSHSFSTAGTYTVEVTLTDSIGETYSASVTVTINNNPSVSVSSSQNPTDVGNSVTYTASESGGTGTISYEWYINGASEGSGSTLSYSFSSSGSYTVEVVVTDSDGHTASSSVTETVYSDPSVSVSSSQNPTDVGNSVTFTASPSGGSGSYTYQWYVGGSAVSGATSSTYTTSFSASGTEEVYVIIHDSVGNSAQSSTLDETVNADPSVSVSSSQNPTDAGNTVTFTASGTGGTGSYSYQWYLNGNAVSGATSSTYSTSFSSSGSDTVYVVLTDGVGNSATSSTITETVNPDPSVTISSSQNPTDIGNSVTFTASGSGGTGAFTYTWYLNGATQSSTSSTFSYSFSSAGTYYVNVTVKDSLGDSASYSLNETVYSDPSATISSSQNPTDVGNSVTFTSSPSGGSGSYTYQWYLNGNAVSGATSSTYATSFSSVGTESVYVIIHDSVGNSAQSSTITETVNPDPSVGISSSQNPTDVGNSVTFTASGSGVYGFI